MALALLVGAAPAPAQSETGQRQAEFEQKIRPLLARYCYSCHGDMDARAPLVLAKYRTPDEIRQARKVWEGAIAQLRGGSMPPDEAKFRPTDSERLQLIEWLSATLASADCRGSPEPGRVTLRRLTRYEYRNTVRDLTGIDYEPADDFPADDTGYGFDNIGDVLSLPPILLEKYLTAAEQVATKAIVVPPKSQGLSERVVAANMKVVDGRVDDVGMLRRGLLTNATLEHKIDVDRPGEYEITIEAGGDQAGDEPPKMALAIDGKQERQFAVKNSRTDGRHFTHKRRLAKGSHTLAISFLNDFWNEKEPDPTKRDRNLIVYNLRVSGPLNLAPPKLPASHERIVVAVPDTKTTRREASEKVIRRLASWAFRRPATEQEVSRLVALTERSARDGEAYEQGIQLALQAILVSPHFLYKVELDPPGKEGQPRDLTDLEVATRLSYFLWSSGPDAELLTHATRGSLLSSNASGKAPGNTLESQVRRMLADVRSKALVEHFASQWLQLGGLADHKPSAAAYPEYTAKLRFAMRRETELFVWTVLREDRSVVDLLSADFTFVNESLAGLYGIPGIRGDQLQRVSTAGTPRGGLLTQASFLTVTSNPNRTSPVKRGKFILDNILGAPPPPPPANVPELVEKELSGTLRQRMEQHRTNPVCASCHQRMDPLGFALENYDGIGRWRERDGVARIDASGQLPTGEKFQGPQELERLLIARKDEFVECLSRKLLTYALGRGLEHYDECAVEKIVAGAKSADYRFSALVLQVVQSDPFLKKGTKRSTP